MIKRIHIPQHTPQWLQWRDEHGYGASEAAGVLAEYNNELADYIYTDPIQIHLQKIGENVNRFSGNINSEAGHYMEGNIIEMARYWDHENPDQMQMFRNMKAGKRMNKIRRCSFFMTNSKYPWLYFSPDGLEYQRGSKGIVECKNSTSYEANRYPKKVSPSFIIQVCQGLLISELDYARILLFIDGYKFEVITLYADDPMVKTIQEQILEYTYKSWMRVLKARMIKEEYGIGYYYQYNPDAMTARQQEGSAILQSMEPDMSGSEHEWEWVRDNVYKTEEPTKMECTQEQWDLLMERLPAKQRIKESELDARKIDEKLIRSLTTYHAAVIGKDTMDEKVAFSYKKDRNGDFSIYVNPKIYV